MTSITTASPWKTNFATKPKPGNNFQEMMDEELAMKLDKEENRVEFKPVEDEEDEDYKLALRLSEQENGNADVTTPTVDSDILLAMQLQQEIDSETVSHLEKEKKQSEKDKSKVSTSVDHILKQYPIKSTPYVPTEAESDEEDEHENESLVMRHERLTEKSRVRLPKHQFTKHDVQLSGVINAEKIEQRLNSGNMVDINVSNGVYNRLREETRREEVHQDRVRGNRADKATYHQVLDQKTRVLLLKLMNSQKLKEIQGVISTGKEANVFYAAWSPLKAEMDRAQSKKIKPKKKPEKQQEKEEAKKESENEQGEEGDDDDEEGEEEDGEEIVNEEGIKEILEEEVDCVVKIYKTSMNEFKNRKDYVEGDWRFRRAKDANNPRKVIQLWAEKEMRNLLRIQQNGLINCPIPYYVKDNILVMSFIGKDGVAAPRLKDAPLKPERLESLYQQCVRMMRNLYQKSHLIHADLSEYNMLVHKGELYVIDVSQSVEWDHPSAMDFLRTDCNAVTQFFKKAGVVNCMSPKDLFDFVTDITIKNEDKYLEALHAEIEKKSVNPDETQTEKDFQTAHITRSLSGFKGSEEPVSPGIYGLSPNKYEKNS